MGLLGGGQPAWAYHREHRGIPPALALTLTLSLTLTMLSMRRDWKADMISSGEMKAPLDGPRPD